MYIPLAGGKERTPHCRRSFVSTEPTAAASILSGFRQELPVSMHSIRTIVFFNRALF
jgi:hypothetical protein